MAVGILRMPREGRVTVGRPETDHRGRPETEHRGRFDHRPHRWVPDLPRIAREHRPIHKVSFT